MLCICCSKKIEPIYNDDILEEELIFESEQKGKGMWNDGILGTISAGYGSNKDGDVYKVAICDDCLEIKINTGVVAVVANYISPVSSRDFLIEQRELWKKFN